MRKMLPLLAVLVLLVGAPLLAGCCSGDDPSLLLRSPIRTENRPAFSPTQYGVQAPVQYQPMYAVPAPQPQYAAPYCQPPAAAQPCAPQYQYAPPPAAAPAPRGVPCPQPPEPICVGDACTFHPPPPK